MSTLIKPIGTGQQQLVIARTESYIQRAECLFARSFETIPVVFNLSGRAAGMYRARNRRCEIRYNPFIFAKYFEDNLANTVPHEVAHYICDRVYGAHSIRPHGNEWRSLMRGFGVTASVTADYDLDGIPVRRQKRYSYRCSCRVHALSSRRHNRVVRREARYFCRACGAALRPAG